MAKDSNLKGKDYNVERQSLRSMIMSKAAINQ